MSMLPRAFGLALCLSSVTAQGVEGPVVDGETRLAYWKQHLAMREQSPHGKRQWRWIGPRAMSGRVTDIAVPRGQRWTFYVATASGGLWKTENEGTTWQSIFADAPSASIGAVACAPSAPDTVWVGLGEANIFRSSMSGPGVFKSRDAGKTWQHMGLTDTQHVGRIIVHPKDPDIVWVAASGKEWSDNPERGVFMTVNGGLTWKKVLYGNERTGAIDLQIHPRNPKVLYAAMWDRIRLKWSDPKPGPGSGIYKSMDGGRTWRRLSKGLPVREKTGRIGLAVSGKPGVVYALIDNHEIARQPEKGERDSYGRPRKAVIKGGEVYRSDDRGESWAKVSESTRLMERLFSTYGWVFGQIRVDPNDHRRLFIMGVAMLTSSDGGKTFKSVQHPGLHGDPHAMWIDPADSKHIINGNDGGVNVSYDGGKTWKNDELLPVVQFYNVAYDMRKPFRVYGSIQDNNSWMAPVTNVPGRSGGGGWQRCPGGEACYHAVDPADENVLYSESFYGRIQRSTLEPRATKSIVPKAEKGQAPLRGQWLAPFVVSPHNPFVIYHGMQYLFRSVNRGDDWERISPDVSYNDPAKRGDISFQTITSISESPRKFGLLYVGTDDGRVWRTDDGGQKWYEIVTGLPTRKWVSRVTASRHDLDTVYLAQNGKRDCDFRAWLFASKDRGRSWRDISKGIPGGPINVVKEDPGRPGVLYVGTDLGVYVTTDHAESWHVLGTGLPITFVHDLIVHPRDRILVVATHGRGMWKLDVKSLAAGGAAKRRIVRR
ncbi:MAG: hypothetical protein CMJ85_01975 [Planctomycetes bacterium]|nr:hypothetical protein [Planctomycetota bacterium]